MIWTYGVRNSFGLAIHPVTGDLWETENGDDSWDEVNIFPAGSNSGWIQLIGPPERFAEFKQIEMDSEDGMDNRDFPPDKLAADVDEAQQRMLILEGSTYVPPVFAWKHPVAVTSIGFVTDDDARSVVIQHRLAGHGPDRQSVSLSARGGRVRLRLRRRHGAQRPRR